MIWLVISALVMLLAAYVIFQKRFKPPVCRAFTTDEASSYKMVLLIRTDLAMSKGKAAAQSAHAAIAAYQAAARRQPQVLEAWLEDGQAKVTLKVESESEMKDLVRKARDAGVIAETIRDAGRTQLIPGTMTVAAVGPAPLNIIDLITGHLKLY